MKCTTLITLVANLSTLCSAATATVKSHPALDALLAKAYSIMDLEGVCAKQACEAINTRKRHLCNDASKIDEYRPQCGEVLRRSNLQSPPGGEDIKIAPEVERKLRKLAEGMKSGGAATTMAEGGAGGSNEEEEGEGLGLKDFEKILKDAGVDIPGMSGMGRKEEL